MGNDLPTQVEIRGEVIMYKSHFEELNIQRLASGESQLANPRNTTAGTLKMQDSAVVAQRTLNFFAYQISEDATTNIEDSQNMERLRKWGFKLSGSHQRCNSLEEVFNYLDIWDSRRSELDFDIDGIVIKVNDKKYEVNHMQENDVLDFIDKFDNYRDYLSLGDIEFIDPKPISFEIIERL